MLEEVKSGAVMADDRRVFWNRIRATVAMHPGITVSVRLTVNPDNLPTAHHAWKGLAAAAATATKPTRRAGAVRSARGLAEEALYNLTRRSPKGTAVPPLKEAAARKLLAALDYNDRQSPAVLEAGSLHALRQLSRGLTLRAVFSVVHGELARRAASSSASDHTFVAADIRVAIEVLEKFNAIGPEAAALWRDLVARSPSLREAATISDDDGGLAYQPWRDMQPELATVVDGTATGIAIVGRGGSGKSIALARALEEQPAGTMAVLISAQHLVAAKVTTIREAIEVGAFVAGVAQQSLVVGVDAVETFGSTVQQQALLAALAGAQSQARVFVTVRLFDWRTLAGTQSTVAGWPSAALDDWPVATVRALTSSSARPDLPTRLVELLSTPLLLDLFLRVFGKEAAVPVGLQARHGVLSAYWYQRVLPTDHADAPERRTKLDEAARAEASGIAMHALRGKAPKVLASEGVFSAVQGRYRFRHALLRDFALMRWATADPRAPAIAKRFGKVAVPLIRLGLARALVEALSEEDSGTGQALAAPEVVASLLSKGEDAVALVGTVLGQLDDPRGLDLERLLAHAPAEPAEELVRRAVHVARITLARGWLAPLTRLPATTHFADATAWFSSEVLKEMVDLLEVFHRDLPSELLLPELAVRVRIWSTAQRIAADLHCERAWHLGHAVAVVAPLDPSPGTLGWMLDVATKVPGVRRHVVGALPSLVAAAQRARSPLSGPDVAAVYQQTLAADPSQPELPPMWFHEWIVRALLGQHAKTPGLLDQLPTVFLPAAFELLATAGAPESEPRPLSAELLADLEKQQREWAEARGRLAEYEAAEALRTVAGPPLDEDTALGGLVDDLHVDTGTLHDWSALASFLRTRLASALGREPAWIPDVYFPAATASRSMLARALVLRVLADAAAAPAACETLADHLVTDARLYQAADLHHDLHRTIARRWSPADDATRSGILAALRGLMRSPFVDGVAAIPPLLSAIPADAWPPDLVAYVTGGAEASPPADPALRVRTRSVRAVPYENDYFDRHLHKVTLGPDVIERWRTLVGAVDSSPPSAAAVTRSLEAAIVGGLPAAERATEFDWMLTYLARALGVAGVTPTELVVEALSKWLLEVMRGLSVDAVHANREPVARLQEHDLFQSPWLTAAKIVGHAVLLQPATKREAALAGLLDELERILVVASPRIEVGIFLGVPADAFGASARGKTLLGELLLERIQEGTALLCAVGAHVVVSGVGELACAQRWLSAPRSRPIVRAGQLVDDLGQALAQSYFTHDDVARLVNTLLTAPPLQGALADADAWRRWLGALVYGAKVAMIAAAPKPWAAYASLMRVVWGHLAKVPWSSEPEKFALHVTDLTEKSADDFEAAWTHIEPLLRSVLREGRADEVHDTIFGLRDPDVPLALVHILPLLEALDERRGDASTPGEQGYFWSDAFGYACDIVDRLATGDTLDAERTQAYRIIEGWTRAPLHLRRAIRSSVRLSTLAEA